MMLNIYSFIISKYIILVYPATLSCNYGSGAYSGNTAYSGYMAVRHTVWHASPSLIAKHTNTPQKFWLANPPTSMFL